MLRNTVHTNVISTRSRSLHVELFSPLRCSDILQGICFVYSRLYGMLHNMLYQHKNNHHILTKHLGHHQGLNPGSFEYWMQH